MKKIFLCVALLAVVVSSCKKKNNDSSITVTESAPTITLTGSQYYSIPVGGGLPSIEATAYDSFYKEQDQIIVDQSTLDNTTPGLYAVTISAKNKYGMIGYNSVYIAVTNVSASLDVSGTYIRNANPTATAYVTKLATGLFMTSNVGGVDTVTAAGSVVAAVFAVTSDTTIDFGTQLTSAGTLTASAETLTLSPAPITFSYIVGLNGFSPTAVRTFVKQ